MRPRIPATAIRGHLMWTRSGTVWATWRLHGLPKGLGSSEINAARRRMHRALLQAVLGEYMIIGANTDISADSIAERMIDGVDIDNNPDWAEEVLLTAEMFDRDPLTDRDYWLAAPLRPSSMKHRAALIARMAEDSARELAGLPLRPPSTDEIADAMLAAAKVESALPGVFKPRRASTQEQIWLADHAMLRGLWMNRPAPDPDTRSLESGSLRGRLDDTNSRTLTRKSYPTPHLDEGAKGDKPKGTIDLGRMNPFQHRYLKVTSSADPDQSSYQVLMALSGSPKGGWEEDLDWIGMIDELGVGADWVFRIRTVSASEAKRKNTRSEVNITDQMDQTEGSAAITGSGGELDDTALLLAEYQKALSVSPREVEVQPTLIVAVGADTADEAKEKASFLQKSFSEGLDFRFDAPVGSQEALWWAMLPGSPTSRVVNEFVEYTTGTQFATLAPITNSNLGDRRGFLFSRNITSGSQSPVFIDLEGQITGDVSGSVALVGEPGGGKSVAIKIFLGATFERGNSFITIDRTSAREYGTFAKSLDETHTAIVDLVDPAYTLDPLRVFGPRIGANHMLTLSSAILGVTTRSDEGVLLAQLLSEGNVDQRRFTSALDVLEELRRLGEADPIARRIAGLMNVYATTELGASLFNRNLPPLDLTKRGIVFLTHGLELPHREEVANPRQFDQLGPRKIFGYGMYALLIDISREHCFADKNKLVLFGADELSHITSSPQGTQKLNDFYIDGRKHKAPVVVGSQDADHLGDEIGKAMIKNRILTRQTDIGAATRNLEWMQKGFGDDPRMITTVTEELSPLGPDGKVPEDRRGEALFRDAQGRMGKIRTLIPRRPHRAAATLSTPSEEYLEQVLA